MALSCHCGAEVTGVHRITCGYYTPPQERTVMAKVEEVKKLDNHPRINGKCPTCNSTTLFLGAGGFVTCSNLNCSDPNYVSVIMDQLPRINKLLTAAIGIELPRS